MDFIKKKQLKADVVRDYYEFANLKSINSISNIR